MPYTPPITAPITATMSKAANDTRKLVKRFTNAPNASPMAIQTIKSATGMP